MKSPSTRRAWIEITRGASTTMTCAVALHPEGVDRNNARSLYNYDLRESPSTRRAWIEIIACQKLPA